MKPMLGLTLAALLWPSVSLQAAQPGKEELVEQVRKAIEDGKKFLRQQQVVVGDGTGHWEVDVNSAGHGGGWTCLTMLALLNAGEKPEAEVVKRGLKYLREQGTPRKTYAVALQTMVFAEAGDPQDKARIQKNVDWLVESRVLKGGQLIGWGYEEKSISADNSNTQYALLGLWAGKQAGAKIDQKTWEAIRDFYLRTQQQDGSWTYRGDVPMVSMTMTVAGLCGLYIVGQELDADRQQLQKNGVALKCGNYDENAAIAKAANFIKDRFTIDRVRLHIFYHLYGLERAGRLSGQRFFGDHDWYREGCQYLIKNQHDDGSWYLRGQGFDAWPVVSTDLALLFLSKGRTPILMSKLVHGQPDNPGLDWHRKRGDLRNLTDFASRELFKRQPLGWQIFNAREVRPTNDEEVRQVTGELLQSPIAYFSGHNRPQFTAWEKKMLQQYVEGGGFILAEACCGAEGFDRGFRDLMKELFPDNPLTPLPAGHPLWQSHFKVPPGEFKLEGIELGCKTVVVYSPQPISGWWEGNQHESGRGQLAFRVGGNIIAYATGLEPPKPRLTHIEVADNKPESKVPRGYLKPAQLRQSDGNWRSAANGIRNLMLDLRKTARMDVALQAQELYPDDKDILNYKFLYLHGRDQFSIKRLELLRANLETGGVLLADACCGRKEFDESFRAFVKELFPDRKLEPIPTKDDLFSAALNGAEITSVRCRRERPESPGADGGYQNVAPALEGIKIDNRWVVIYSKYDLGCALEKHVSPDCLGHDHDSAVKLARAAVLYALQR
ncbi:MAG: DUF4159 domain-containing protein [Planctomycetia bacterium]|nr:DUF4159 domain-containing protein [Planctomycetia bacterium]